MKKMYAIIKVLIQLKYNDKYQESVLQCYLD